MPIHWAVSFNHFDIVELLVSQKGFDPDVEVCLAIYLEYDKRRMLTVPDRMDPGGRHL